MSTLSFGSPIGRNGSDAARGTGRASNASTGTGALEGIRSLRDQDVAGKRVFVRVDFNVPMDGRLITDDSRLRASIPTIRHILDGGGKVVLASHLGRPEGKPDARYSLEPVCSRLAELIGLDVVLSDDCIGDGARKVVHDLRDGQIAVLENLRFHPDEEKNDERFARELARFADVYVNDAFGVSHRAHASVCKLPQIIEDRCAGFLMEQELKSLSKLAAAKVGRPFVAILGGAKVSDKIGVIESLLARVDALLIGGAMANTFLAATGLSLGKSRVEPERYALVRSLLARAKEQQVELVLPIDVAVGRSLQDSVSRNVSVHDVQPEDVALDIGTGTIAAFAQKIRVASTVFWNGPMGLFENPAFADGTFGVARALATAQGFTVVGGGDSVAAIHAAGLGDRYSHISTGGGASLEYVEGRKLPGVEALRSV
jgi:phosphoglycerate kinase